MGLECLEETTYSVPVPGTMVLAATTVLDYVIPNQRPGGQEKNTTT